MELRLHENNYNFSLPSFVWKYLYAFLSSLETPLICSSHVQHPVQSLPYDAYKLLAVPTPIGGVIVFCANSLYYHSQVLISYLK